MKPLTRTALRTFAVEVVAVLPHPWAMSGLAGEAHAGIGSAAIALEVVAELSVQDASRLRIARLA